MRLHSVPEMSGDIYRIVSTLVLTPAISAGSSAPACEQATAGIGAGANALAGGERASAGRSECCA